MKSKNIIIQTSGNYEQFRHDATNRESKLNPKLLESMKTYGWLNAYPMHVYMDGEKLVIKDGQHRFEAAKALKIPVKFVIQDKDGISTPQINNIAKRWSLRDYVCSWANQGKKAYSELREFSDEYSIPLNIAASILYGVSGSTSAIIKDGTFKIRAYDHAMKIVSVIQLVGSIPTVKWAKNSFFVSALGLIFLHTNADVKTLCDRLRSNPSLLILQPTVMDFVSMIENIYNRRNQKPVYMRQAIEVGLKAQRKENIER